LHFLVAEKAANGVRRDCDLHKRGAGGGQWPPRGRRPRRAKPRQDGPPRQLLGTRRRQEEPRKVSHGQVRIAPDESHPQTPCRRDVALRRAPETLRNPRGEYKRICLCPNLIF